MGDEAANPLPDQTQARRSGCLIWLARFGVALVVLWIILWVGLQIYVNHGAGEFAREAERRHDHMVRVLAQIPFGPVQSNRDEPMPTPGSDAALAYKISRYPLSGLAELFICGDNCPGWAPSEPLYVSMHETFYDPAHNLCATEEGRLLSAGWNLPKTEPSRYEPGIECQFVGTHDGVSITIEVLRGNPGDASRDLLVEGTSPAP